MTHCIAPCIFRVRKSKKNFLLDGLTAVKISHLHVLHIDVKPGGELL